MIKPKKGQSYNEKYKLLVLDELRSGTLSRNEIILKYGVSGRSIQRWERKFDNHYLRKRVKKKKTNKSYETRIKELEQALANERMKRLLYEEIINIAENEYKIPILKKQDTKRSKK